MRIKIRVYLPLRLVFKYLCTATQRIHLLPHHTVLVSHLIGRIFLLMFPACGNALSETKAQRAGR